MKWHKALAAAGGLAILTATPGTAQVTTQELFHVKFRATCKPGNDAGGRHTRMRDRDLIELCVGSGFSQRDLRRNFALVYSPATDSIQVADAQTGAILCDVFQFQGGTIVTNNNRLERFTFVFIPTDETAAGSAVITERTVGINQGNPRARINGRVQFTVPDGVNWVTNHSTDLFAGVPNESAAMFAANANRRQHADGNTNNGTGDLNGSDDGTGIGRNEDDNRGDSNGTGGGGLGPFVQAAAAAETVTLENAQVCTGTFTVGRAFVPGVPGGGGDDDDGDDGDGLVNGGDGSGGVTGETPANGRTNGVGNNLDDNNGNGSRNGVNGSNGVNGNNTGTNGVTTPPTPPNPSMP